METQPSARTPDSQGSAHVVADDQSHVYATKNNTPEVGTAGTPPNLRIIGVESSHDTLRRVVGSKPPATILDVPAGEGVFCAFLRDKGWDVHAADIDPGNFRLRDIPFTRVNLNQVLPFDNASFDAVS